MTETMTQDATFWNRIAEKYARDKIADIDSYEATLDRVRSHLAETDRVVELGCGTGTTALRLADAVADYLATDISSEMCRIGAEKASDCPNLRFAVGTAETDALVEPGSVDAVLSFNHLHLVPDAKQTLIAAARMLKPGGLLIAKTACLNETWKMRAMKPVIGLMTLFGKAPKTVRFFDVQTHDQMVIDAGFDIIETGFYAYPRRFVVAKKL